MLVIKTTYGEMNKLRKSLGLPPIIRKKVPCLSCRKEFESKDYPRQRMCIECRYNTDDDPPVYSVPKIK